jgi:hypothetical protein
MSLSIELAGIISVKLTRNIRKSIYKLPTNENADQQLILFLCKRLLLQTANPIRLFRRQKPLFLPLTFAKPTPSFLNRSSG